MRTGAKIGSTLFLGVFLLAGLVVLYIMGSSLLQTASTRSWQQVPCTIQASGWDSRTTNGRFRYVWTVSYSYEVDGQSYTSALTSLDDKGSKSFRDIQRQLLRYPSGSQATCFVDPYDSGTAILNHDPLWSGALILLLPLIFIAVGGGGIAIVWLKGDEANQKGTTRGHKQKRGAGCFFLVFSLVGFGFFIPFGLLPGITLLQAQLWEETPCRIMRSEIRTEPSDKNSTYWVDIHYLYQYDGIQYRSNAYNWASGTASSGSKSKSAITREHRVSSETTCWVNPADPTQAVLSKGVRPLDLLGPLIPAIFILAGLVGWWKTRPTTDAGSARDASGGRAGRSAGVLPLKRAHSRFSIFMVIAVATLIFGGVELFILQKAFQSLSKGRTDFGLVIMSLIFGVIVLVLIGVMIQRLLALFNPTPSLALMDGCPALGGTMDLQWRLRGRADKLSQLTITLIGRESATYQRGTKTYTSHNDFITVALLDTQDPREMTRGGVRLTLPADTMHSFVGGHNKVVWLVVVHGEIPRWPDIDDEFPIDVSPADLEARDA